MLDIYSDGCKMKNSSNFKKIPPYYSYTSTNINPYIGRHKMRPTLKTSTIENHQSLSEESTSSTTKNNHKCTTCGKYFNSPSKLLRHMNSSVHQAGLKPYECDVCRFV